MAFNPDEITKQHILSAIKRIVNENIDLIPSTKYDVIIEGKSYPPKEVMRYSHEEMNGERVWELSGGEPTHKYLRKFDFEIVNKQQDTEKINELISRYKTHIRENGFKDEIYKWELLHQFKGRPDIQAVDFLKEIKSINFDNFIYGIGYAAIYHIAKDKTEEYRKCFEHLFNDSIGLQNRIDFFYQETLKIYRELVPDTKYSHHQDERTMATFLTFHNPEKYTFFKDSFYQKLCRLIGIKARPKGKKYVHYLELIDELIEEHILPDNELLQLKEEQLPDTVFSDTNHKILAQDILYQTLDKQVGLGRNYWRVGTTDDQDNYWEFMKENGKICVGWKETGDLRGFDINSKKDIQKIFDDEGFYKDDKRTSSRKAGELHNFYYGINTGDIILAQNGYNVLGIGTVEDEYFYDESVGFPHQKEVKWLVLNPEIKNTQGNQTTIYLLDDPKLINNVNQLIESEKLNQIKSRKAMQNKIPLNQILYGPPGTGKTFSTVNYALKIIGEEQEQDLDWDNREEVKKIYNQRVKEGRIVFTTFHQSMSYEDFIEGIKPDTQNGNVIYDVIPGVFKKLCSKASSKVNANFKDTYLKFIKDISESGEAYKELKTKSRDASYWVGVNSNSNLSIYTTKNKNYQGVMTKEKLERYADGEKILEGWEGYADGVIEKLKNEYGLSRNTIDNTKNNFVLIIDEINRGNISQIFGELITLIEKDKREGALEEIEVVLPYSKESFKVPSNVYLIGTMNTADRSVEALDTALRRRFSFIEIQPNPNLIKSVGKAENGIVADLDLSDILKIINRRIEKLLNKDHMIGHSYFLKVSDIDELKNVFQNKIIPLLQEYFFGDYGKIGLVIGSGFFEPFENNENSFGFAAFDDGYDSGSLGDKKVYHLKNAVDMENDEFIEAINILLE
jgi:5-methylcytosine-specific restriction protein B